MPEFLLPDVGEGLTEAEIVEWHVKVGDVVDVNDVLVDIETAKSVVELPSPFAGTVTALLVEPGSTVAVGTPIIAIREAAIGEATIGEAGGSPAPAVEDGEAAASAPPSVEPEGASPGAGGEGDSEEEPLTLVGYGPKEGATTRRPRRTAAAAGAPAADAVLAKPPVRLLARELGVDLGSVTPTGPHQTISRADVEAAAGLAAPGGAARPSGWGCSGWGCSGWGCSGWGCSGWGCSGWG